MITLSARNSLSRSPLRRGVLLIALASTCLALSPAPKAFGVTPAPDGGYPNETTAEGDGALFSLTIGADNTAIGFDALFSNTEGFSNTANGAHALGSNTTGWQNTANGWSALINNTTGTNNTATGVGALFSNTTGNGNTANGVNALGNSTGNRNTAIGDAALVNNTTGNFNIALGDGAGGNLTTGDNNIDIGNTGVAGETAKIRIGTVGTHTNAAMAGIYGVNVAKGVGVVIDSNGQLGTKGSSERFKEAIKPMEKASEAILSLKPVAFRYKKELDPDAIPQFGLIAEEVAKVNPDLVARDEKEQVYTVRYEAVNAMLLNEFLKDHRKVEEQDCKAREQEARLTKQEAIIAQQQKEIKALSTGLQKVSAQFELSKSASRTVSNNQ